MSSPKGTTPKIAPKASTSSGVAAAKSATDTPSLVTPKAPINRGFYETVDGGEGGDEGPADGQSTKPSVVGGYVKLGVTEKAPEEEVGADDDDDSEKRRQERRRRILQEELETTKQIRGIIIGCSGLIFLILIVAGIAAGIYFSTLSSRGKGGRTKKSPFVGGDKQISYGYGECMEVYKRESKDFRPKCITAKSLNPQENEKCGLQCTRNMFRLADPDAYKGEPLPFSPEALAPQIKTFINDLKAVVFCQGWDQTNDRPSLDPLTLCVAGLCNVRYNGSDKDKAYSYDLSSVARGTWEDACDEPQPCWESEELNDKNIFELSVFMRNSCIPNARCPQDGITSAIVYLQQMECVMNEDGLGPFCELEAPPPAPSHSTPMFRLYKCKTCLNYTSGKPSSTELEQQHRKFCQDNGHVYHSTEATKCSVLCKTTTGQLKREILPDGAFCDQGNAINYCVQGGCFWWNSSLTSETIDKSCGSTKKNRTDRETRFGEWTWGRGNRGKLIK